MPKKSILRGAIILAFANIIAKFMGFFFRIPIIYMIGEEGIGLYQLTYPLYGFLLALSGGMPVAISKMISERAAFRRYSDCKRIYRASIFVMLIIGGISSFALIVFAEKIIKLFSWNRQSYYSLLGISLAPFFTCLVSVYRGYFQGLQNMAPSGTSQIIEQLGRVVAGVFLVYILLPYGIGVSAGGASFGATFGAIIAFIFLYIAFKKNQLPSTQVGGLEPYRSIVRELLVLAIPISLSHAMSAIMALIDSLTVPKLLKIAGYTDSIATALYGQLTGKAFVLINVPLTLSIALAQSTVPAISEAYALKNKNELKKNMQTAFKFASILAFASASGLYTLARPIFNLIFQGMDDGWELLQLLSIAVVFIILSQIAISILNGIGETKLPLISMCIGSVIKFIISVKLIPISSINIKGAAYGTIISYIVIAALNIYFMFKYTKVKLDLFGNIVVPLFCSATMIFIVVIAYTKFYAYTLSMNIATVLSILIGCITYLILLVITKAIDIGVILQKISHKR